MKLLIVDPDRDLVEMLTSWLKTLGYEVYRAYTGDRAKIEWEEQGCGCLRNVSESKTET
jgi:DNA-binding response OmpR family regulator